MVLKMYKIFIFFWFLFSFATSELLVNTKHGDVLGYIKKSYGEKSYIAFEGIPFAKPPVGELRFAEAVSADPWDTPLAANKTYDCYQYFPIIGKGFLGTEDCLYVYVYVTGEDINPENNYDVIVHIHGGAYRLGSPKMMARPDYVMDREVIYVTFNYRLGALGFLSTQDNVVPGNNALKDQTLALKWIKDNIKNFGGNPDSITLTGSSAGAASVHLHYLSPKSKGLFNRGWCLSDGSLNPWVITEKPMEKAKKLGELLNCTTEDSSEMVKCMRSLEVENIGMAYKKFFVFYESLPIAPFGAVVETGDDGFLTKTPLQYLSKGEIENDVPLIISTTEEEGIYPAGLFSLFGVMDQINDNWTSFAPYVFDFQDTLTDDLKDVASKKIKERYFGDDRISKENVMSLVKAISDRIYYLGVQKTARLHSKFAKSPVYFYFFSYEPEQMNIFPGTKGAAHTDDAKLIFQLVTAPLKLSENDSKVSNLLSDILTSYAKTGKPEVNAVEWPPMDDSENINYLHIRSGDDYKMESTPEFASEEFWNGLGIEED